MNDKLKETIGVTACIVLLISIGFYTGFFNDHKLSDFEKLVKDASSDFKSIDGNLNLGNSNSKIKNNNTSRIDKYRANNILDGVYEGSRLSGFWKNVFASNKKVVFYVYDSYDNNKKYSKDFHDKVLSAYEKGKMNNYYNFEATDLSVFKNYNVGIVGSTKICNSLEECNQQRNLATKRSEMQMFLDRCSTGFCIINNKKKEFVMLRHRNSDEAINALKTLKNW